MQVLSLSEINNRFKRKRIDDNSLGIQSKNDSNRQSSSSSSVSSMSSNDDDQLINPVDEVALLKTEMSNLRNLVLSKSKKCRKYKNHIKKLRKTINELTELNLKYQQILLSNNVTNPKIEPTELETVGNDSVTDDIDYENIDNDEDREYKDLICDSVVESLDHVNTHDTLFGSYEFDIIEVKYSILIFI